MDILLGVFIFALTCLIAVASLVIVTCMAGLVRRIKLDGDSYMKKKLCSYKIDSDGMYKTGCGNDFYDASESGDIKSWATYCPYCAGKINASNE